MHKSLGQRTKEHVEVTAYEPNWHVRHWSTGRPMPLEVNYIFEEASEIGTRLTVSADAQQEGFFKLIAPVAVAVLVGLVFVGLSINLEM